MTSCSNILECDRNIQDLCIAILDWKRTHKSWNVIKNPGFNRLKFGLKVHLQFLERVHKIQDLFVLSLYWCRSQILRYAKNPRFRNLKPGLKPSSQIPESIENPRSNHVKPGSKLRSQILECDHEIQDKLVQSWIEIKLTNPGIWSKNPRFSWVGIGLQILDWILKNNPRFIASNLDWNQDF